MTTPQLQFLMMIFAGWVNRSQQDVIEYLQAENRVLREQLGDGYAKAGRPRPRGIAEISQAVPECEREVSPCAD